MSSSEKKSDQPKPSKTPDTASDVSRRDFLKTGVVAGVATGVGAGALYFGYGRSVGNPVRFGIIGTGDEGGVLIGALNPDYVDVVAISDIRPYNIQRAFHGHQESEGTLRARPGLLTKYGYPSERAAREHVKVYEQYQDLLDDPAVEAVIIALPLFLHCPVAIQAMAKGKHVLTEKLMAHDVTQCKEMSRFAAEQDLLLATGHQRHYSFLYDDAVNAIKSGQIGTVHHIRAQWHRNNVPGNDSWHPALPNDEMLAALEKKQAELIAEQSKPLDPKIAKEQNIKAMNVKRRDDLVKQVAKLRRKYLDHAVKAADFGYTDFDLKDATGNVARKVSALEELIRWRLWRRTGGGLMAELGSHQLDAASIFLSALRTDGRRMNPLSVVANGTRNVFPLDRDVDDHVYGMYEFPGDGYYAEDGKTIADPNKKVVVSYSSINGNGFGGYGEVVMGTEGTLRILGEKPPFEFVPAPGSKKKATSVGVSSGAGGAVTVDSYETGGVEAAAVTKAGGPDSRGYTEEMEHFAWCIRNRDPENIPRCHPEVALADACMALVGNKAMWGPGRIEFKPEWFDINSDETPDGTKPDPKRHLA